MRIVRTRRRFMCALGSAVLSLVSPVKLRGSEKKDKRPNVLFIAIDSLPANNCEGERSSTSGRHHAEEWT